LSKLKQAQVHLVQSERLAAVGELAAGIAHEVNNPVNFALNAARAMETTVKELREVAANIAALDSEDVDQLARQLEAFKASEQQRGADDLVATLIELAGIVGEGLKRTHSLVGDLRDFAAMGGSTALVAGVDVEAGLLSTVQLLKHNLAQRNAAIDLDIEEGLPTIHGDAGALNQVFLNLIKNAAESFGQDGGSIQITLTSAKNTVVVSISDDGPGIAVDVISLVFDPFFTTKGAGEGTGLGLSISQNIISAHGGELSVESEVGSGTRFSIRLPTTPPTRAATESQ
jgi:signal transduction histidine kinase